MSKKRDLSFPDRDAIVAFIRANPGKVGTREIAREFGLKNADRAELKRILRELADRYRKLARRFHELFRFTRERTFTVGRKRGPDTASA